MRCSIETMIGKRLKCREVTLEINLGIIRILDEVTEEESVD